MRAFTIATAALLWHVSFGFASPLIKRAVDYYNPLVGGGSMLDSVGEDQSITESPHHRF
jgi:hypothetical protein